MWRNCSGKLNITSAMNLASPKQDSIISGQERTSQSMHQQPYQSRTPSITMAAPLTDQTRKDCPTKVIWTPVLEKSFVSLRDELLKMPVLKCPDYQQRFILQTDGYWNSFKPDGPDRMEHPIAYYSMEETSPTRAEACCNWVWVVSPTTCGFSLNHTCACGFSGWPRVCFLVQKVSWNVNDRFSLSTLNWILKIW